MKLFFRYIHLWLSLAAGLVILICCLTGAILVFQKELEQTFYSERYFVEQQHNKLPAKALLDAVKKAQPSAKINSLKTYTDPARSAEINISITDDHQKAKDQQAPGNKNPGAPSGRPPSFTVFVNPYTAAILETYNPREGFFFQVMSLHRWLLGDSEGIGKTITGIATLIFLFILITGIILWWPKTNKILIQRLKIKRNAGWKRFNHDLHIVLGFYSAIFLFIFSFTALAWSFEWFNNGIYTVTNSPVQPPAPPRSTYIPNQKTIDFDIALSAAKNTFTAVHYYNISKPKDSIAPIIVTALSNLAPHESAGDAVYIDQYSGKVLGTLRFSEKSLGSRVRSTFRPVHVGSIYGTPSKIIAFVVCLLGVSFPVTGIVMWVNRLRKKKHKRQSKPTANIGATTEVA